MCRQITVLWHANHRQLYFVSEMSEDLLQYFEDPVILQHPGGHFIPAAGPQKKIYLEFLDKMLENKTIVSSWQLVNLKMLPFMWNIIAMNETSWLSETPSIPCVFFSISYADWHWSLLWMFLPPGSMSRYHTWFSFSTVRDSNNSLFYQSHELSLP